MFIELSYSWGHSFYLEYKRGPGNFSQVNEISEFLLKFEYGKQAGTQPCPGQEQKNRVLLPWTAS